MVVTFLQQAAITEEWDELLGLLCSAERPKPCPYPACHNDRNRVLVEILHVFASSRVPAPGLVDGLLRNPDLIFDHAAQAKPLPVGDALISSPDEASAHSSIRGVVDVLPIIPSTA